MKKLIIIFIVAVTLIRCSSSDNNLSQNNSPTNSISLKVKKITNGTSISNFEYVNGLVSKVINTTPSQNTSIFEYNYENGRIKQIYSYELTSSGSTVNPSTIIYSYTGSKITSDTNNDNGVNYSDSYIYNNDLLLNRKEFRSNGTINNNYDFEYFSDTNVKKETQTNTIVFVKNFSSYDTKFNYEKLIFTPELQLIYRTPKNNLLISDNATFEYEYNSQNYPTKITRKNNGIVSFVKVLEYQ